MLGHHPGQNSDPEKEIGVEPRKITGERKGMLRSERGEDSSLRTSLCSKNKTLSWSRACGGGRPVRPGWVGTSLGSALGTSLSLYLQEPTGVQLGLWIRAQVPNLGSSLTPSFPPISSYLRGRSTPAHVRARFSENAPDAGGGGAGISQHPRAWTATGPRTGWGTAGSGRWASPGSRRWA